MKQAALIKAERKVLKSEACYVSMCGELTDQAFQAYWEDLLVNLAGVFSALEQGAKGHPNSERWFGKKKRLRKTDPLLQYLQQARNAEEHGNGAAALKTPGFIHLRDKETGNIVLSSAVSFDRFETDPSCDAPVTVEFMKPVRMPVSVNNRGVLYDPPKMHLGEKLPNGHLLTVARLGLNFHTLMVQEAFSLGS